MRVHIRVIRHKNANMLERYDRAVMNVLARRGDGGGYENELVIEEHCTTSSAPHDLTLSLLRLVLLPGYYFLWQHLSWRGEQHWKDSDYWRLCILWTGSPYMSSEKRTTAQWKMHPPQKKKFSLLHICQTKGLPVQFGLRWRSFFTDVCVSSERKKQQKFN